VLLNLCLQTEFLYMSQMINVECGHVVGHTFVNLVARQNPSQPIIYATWHPVSES